MHPLLLSTLGQAALSGGAVREIRRTKDNAAPRSAGSAAERLGEAYAQLFEKDQGRAPERKVKLEQNEPVRFKDLIEQHAGGEISEQEFKDAFKRELNFNNFASMQPTFHRNENGRVNSLTSQRGPDIVRINPHTHEEALAHELGHVYSGNTKFGDALQRIRLNPKLSQAIALAGGLTAFTTAGLTPGDDDLNAAIAGQLALSAPTLIDEALASKNALAIMEQSGQRATLGQRGRLAGAYLSYLAAPAGAAVIANTLGNQFDEDI